ncbi:MAG: prealbumin-like fold domain-containing protein [Lachnospiraceae bacterium]|nr:prealbumin-like fold domain-containing protein [Lachnospiraceae bacterium]
MTDEDGQFYLKANQTAVFYGIPAGTVYSVSEVKESGYNQVIPNASTGYTDKVVADNVEVLPFVNEPSPAGMLTVTKVLDITGGVVPNAEDVFTFILYESVEVEQDEEVGEPIYEYVPAAGKVYSVTVGASTYTYSTDEDGKFTLLANQTAVFEGLNNGLYKVEECEEGEDGLTIEYSLETVERTDADGTVLWQTEQTSGTGTAAGGNSSGSAGGTEDPTKEEAECGTLTSEGLTYIFTNAYKACGVDLYLMKKSGDGTALNGAEFMLYYDQALQNPVSTEPYVSGSYVNVESASVDGMISIEDLQAGTYYLVETKAPQGYSLLSEAICIGIVRTAQGFEITINGEEYTEDASTIVGELNITGEEGNEILYLTVYNHKLLPIPMSGSAGSYITLILGLALTLTAVWKALSMTRGKKQRSK